MFIRTVAEDTSLDAFREEIRSFCESELPSEVRRKQACGQHLDREEYDDWMKRLGAKGWLTGKWPKEHGGHGWSPEQHLIFSEELGRAGRAAGRAVWCRYGRAGDLYVRHGNPKTTASAWNYEE